MSHKHHRHHHKYHTGVSGVCAVLCNESENPLINIADGVWVRKNDIQALSITPCGADSYNVEVKVTAVSENWLIVGNYSNKTLAQIAVEFLNKNDVRIDNKTAAALYYLSDKDNAKAVRVFPYHLFLFQRDMTDGKCKFKEHTAENEAEFREWLDADADKEKQNEYKLDQFIEGWRTLTECVNKLL